MSGKRRVKKRQPSDVVRIPKILVGPVYHDPLYRGGYFDDEGNYHEEAVLQRRNPHKMPKNVAPLVCKISKDS